MIYLSKPITGLLFLTSQLFSGRVIFSISSGCGRTEYYCHTCTKPCPPLCTNKKPLPHFVAYVLRHVSSLKIRTLLRKIIFYFSSHSLPVHYPSISTNANMHRFGKGSIFLKCATCLRGISFFLPCLIYTI